MIWNVQILPTKDAIKMYRNSGDLAYFKNEDEAPNRKTINHRFSTHEPEKLIEETKKVLEELGYYPLRGWTRDLNFSIWHGKASTEEIFD